MTRLAWLRRRARDLGVCALWLVLAACDARAENRAEKLRKTRINA